MEILVDVLKAELEEADSSLGELAVECSVKVGEDIYVQRSSVSSSRERVEEMQRWPQFKFHFHTPSPNAALSLSFFAVSASPPTKIGGCMEPLALQQDHQLGESHSLTVDRIRVSYLGWQIGNADVTRFVGKVWFKVKHVFLSPVVLLSRELEHTCHDVYPSITPTVSVVFHSVNHSAISNETGKHLQPLACLGAANSGNGQRKDSTMFESSSSSNQGCSMMTTSILKAVTLACDGQPSLELHIANIVTDSIVFSTSQHLNSLTPFWHYNWQYDLQNQPAGADPRISPSESAHGPNVIVSVTYTPSLAQSTLHQGLELLIFSLELDSSLCGKDVILSIQLVSSNSKEKAQSVKTYEPPFLRNKKKGKVQNSDNFITVITPQASDLISTKPAYFFFSEDPHFTRRQADSDVSVSILLYATDRSSPAPWWLTPLVASCRLDIPMATQRALRLPTNQRGAYWELVGGKITQTHGLPLTTKLCGVVRWKSTQSPFLSKSIESQLSTLPHLGKIVHLESQPRHGEQPQYPLSGAQHQPHSEQHIPSASKHQPHRQPQPPTPPSTGQSSTHPNVPEVSQFSSLLAEHEANSDITNEQDMLRLAEYKDAAFSMGRDILALRQRNTDLQRHNEELSAEVARMQSTAGAISAGDQKVLESLPKAKLIQQVIVLQQNLSAETGSRAFYQNRVQSLQNTLIRKNDFEVQYIQLEEAHAAQQKLVRQLQAKVAKYRRCGALCKQQETFISHLESLLAQQAEGCGNGDAVSLLTRENAQLRAAVQEYQETEPEHKYLALREKEDLIQSLRSQVSGLTGKCEELKKELAQRTRGRSKEEEVFELEQQLAVSEAQVSSLVSRLKENARRWATEKARLEVQLAEYQSRDTTLAAPAQHNPSRVSPPISRSENPRPPPSNRPTNPRITF